VKEISNSLYKKINLITGWSVFAIAAIIYLLTIEPTASFWDCGEFIASAYKLEVGHPPGAPFFMLLGRFFSLFASDTSKVAICINAMSALASAFTIIFLFWTITHLAKKITQNNKEFWKTVAIMGTGIIGALTYTFSDTFWFSAVEGEVYATSSLFTAIVFLAILKWENDFDTKYANRWLIFIAYLMGLSVGVHLLNLLAIPAIVLVYYFKKHEFSYTGCFKALLVSGAILIGIMYVLIPGIPKLASLFELLFVNSFGAPYNTGAIIYMFLLSIALAYGIWYTAKKQKQLANTILLIATVIIIGYSSFALIIIRSVADTPMNQNSPDNPFSLIYYLNREQYGDRPLFKGQYFNAPVAERNKGKAVYIQKDGKYNVSDYKTKVKYDARFTTIFPRMWSNNQPQHIKDYKAWTNHKGKPVKLRDYAGNSKTEYIPTFGENLKFFFRYQTVFMYGRYFMWNFAGRQNDIQGHGDVLRGNWISGIKLIDEWRLGPQNKLPSRFKNNKARNIYYCLPLLLGIFGMAFQYKKSKNDFWVVSMLFIMTGFAIVVYLNQYPHQPRERDYAYAGSFYAFTIWIGLGSLWFIEKLKKLPKGISVISVSTTWLLLVPTLMAVENWDDHDRSGRYTARDFAKNYLNSCEKNAIILTNGDNDTFPLWYAQEVEGVRTDIRVANMSYMRADWYLNQMKRKAYDSEPLPISMTPDKYSAGNRDYILAADRLNKPIDLKAAVDFVINDDPRTQVQSPFEKNKKANILPSKTLELKINKSKIKELKVVRNCDYKKIADKITIKIKDNVITKEGVALLDILANNNWERPLYYAITVGSENYYNLTPYFQLDGLAYRIVPIENNQDEIILRGRVATDIMYDNMINKFVWGGANNPDVYLDENNIRMLTNYRSMYGRLASELINERKSDSATTVLDHCLKEIPSFAIPHNYYSLPLAESYLLAGQREKAQEIADQIFNGAIEELEYFKEFSPKKRKQIEMDIRINLGALQELAIMASEKGLTKNSKEYFESFNKYIQIFSGR